MVLDDMERARVAHTLRNYFPDGPHYPLLYSTVELVRDTVFLLNYACKKTGSIVRLELETDGRKRSKAKVKGLVIFDGSSTESYPMAVSLNVVRLNGQPMHVGHPLGAENLMKEVLRLADAQVAAALPVNAAAKIAAE